MQRAIRAARRARGRADRGPQLHERLVERAGPLRRDAGEQACAHGAAHGRVEHVGIVVRQARHHAQHVPVHGRHGDAKADRRDRAGGILPHAGQREERRIVGGERSVKAFHHLPRRALEVSRAAVIPEPLPQLHQPVVLRFGEVPHRGQRGEEARPVAAHRLHARLLQHDLADPDGICLRCPPPGQVARVCGIPVEQAADPFRFHDKQYTTNSKSVV